MLFGDDLGDFIPCVRRTPLAPCTTGGTIANRYALTDEHAAYWGAGWYILPDPMFELPQMLAQAGNRCGRINDVLGAI